MTAVRPDANLVSGPMRQRSPSGRLRLAFSAFISLSAFTGNGVAQSPSPASRPDTAFTVVLVDHAPYFNPKRLNIPRGATVKWENRGPALVHTIYIVTDAGQVRSGSIRPGESWTHTFDQTDDAVVKTSCEVHPYMYGIVVVGSPPDSLVTALEGTTNRRAGGVPARVLEFPLPVPDSVPGILAIDAEDNVWFTMGGGGFANIELPSLNMVGRLRLDGDFAVFRLPTEKSAPDGLAISPSGHVFVTEYFGNRVARIDPRRRAVEEFPIPTPDSQPTGLAFDTDGNLWFNQNKGNKLGRLTPAGTIAEFVIPTEGSRPTGMVIDAQGDIWFAERDAGKIGRLRRNGTLVEYEIPTPRAKPTGMAVDKRGRVWFAERSGNKIGVVEDERIREYPLPQPNSGPFFLVIDDDGYIWFTELFGNRIGRLDPSTGSFIEHELPTPDAMPGGLGIDSQGNLWFTMQLRNKVGVILRTSQGTPPSGQAAGAASGGRKAPKETGYESPQR